MRYCTHVEHADAYEDEHGWIITADEGGQAWTPEEWRRHARAWKRTDEDRLAYNARRAARWRRRYNEDPEFRQRVIERQAKFRERVRAARRAAMDDAGVAA